MKNIIKENIQSFNYLNDLSEEIYKHPISSNYLKQNIQFPNSIIYEIEDIIKEGSGACEEFEYTDTVLESQINSLNIFLGKLDDLIENIEKENENNNYTICQDQQLFNAYKINGFPNDFDHKNGVFLFSNVINVNIPKKENENADFKMNKNEKKEKTNIQIKNGKFINKFETRLKNRENENEYILKRHFKNFKNNNNRNSIEASTKEYDPIIKIHMDIIYPGLNKLKANKNINFFEEIHNKRLVSLENSLFIYEGTKDDDLIINTRNLNKFSIKKKSHLQKGKSFKNFINFKENNSFVKKRNQKFSIKKIDKNIINNNKNKIKVENLYMLSDQENNKEIKEERFKLEDDQSSIQRSEGIFYSTTTNLDLTLNSDRIFSESFKLENPNLRNLTNSSFVRSLDYSTFNIEMNFIKKNKKFNNSNEEAPFNSKIDIEQFFSDKKFKNFFTSYKSKNNYVTADYEVLPKGFSNYKDEYVNSDF